MLQGRERFNSRLSADSFYSPHLNRKNKFVWHFIVLLPRQASDIIKFS